MPKKNLNYLSFILCSINTIFSSFNVFFIIRLVSPFTDLEVVLGSLTIIILNFITLYYIIHNIIKEPQVNTKKGEIPHVKEQILGFSSINLIIYLIISYLLDFFETFFIYGLITIFISINNIIVGLLYQN